MKDDLSGQARRPMRSRVLRGLGGQAFNQPVAFLIQISSVPLFIYCWGKGLYGEWLILYSIPSYLAISDLGFTTATTNTMVMAVARNERPAALKAFQSTWVLLSLVSVTLVLVSAPLLLSCPLDQWFGFVHLDSSSSALVVTLLLLYAVFNIQSGLLYGVYAAEGAYGFGVFLLGCVRLGEFALLGSVVVMGYGPVVGACVLLGARVFGLLVLRGFLYRTAPWLSYGVAHADLATVRRLWSPSIGFVKLTMGNILNIQGPIVLIGAVLGPPAVVVFSAVRMLARVLIMILSSFQTTLIPEFARAYASNDMGLVRLLHARAMQLFSWFCLFATVGLVSCGVWVVDAWTGGEVVAPPVLLGLLAAVSGVYGLRFSSFLVLYSSNQHQATATTYFILNVLGLLAASVLAGPLGLAGVALALVLVEALMLVHVVRRVLRLTQQRFGEVLGTVIQPPSWKALRTACSRRPATTETP
jgi:O-antigen/teichoic acid export membrane protein